MWRARINLVRSSGWGGGAESEPVIGGKTALGMHVHPRRTVESGERGMATIRPLRTGRKGGARLRTRLMLHDG
jgi:hypothetical protein